MNKGSSASIISGTQSGLALSNKGCNHWSRPSCILMSAWVRFTTRDVFTPGQTFNASSTIPFRSMDLAPRYDPSEVMINLQSLSLILEDRALDENPAKTTE